MAIGLSKAEMQQVFNQQLTINLNLAGDATDAQVQSRAHAVAVLAVIEANNRKIESQLRAKGIQV